MLKIKQPNSLLFIFSLVFLPLSILIFIDENFTHFSMGKIATGKHAYLIAVLLLSITIYGFISFITRLFKWKRKNEIDLKPLKFLLVIWFVLGILLILVQMPSWLKTILVLSACTYFFHFQEKFNENFKKPT